MQKACTRHYVLRQYLESLCATKNGTRIHPHFFKKRFCSFRILRKESCSIKEKEIKLFKNLLRSIEVFGATRFRIEIHDVISNIATLPGQDVCLPFIISWDQVVEIFRESKPKILKD